MLEAGAETSADRILWVDTEDMKHLEKLGEKIMERFGECSGIFCYNDEVAFEMIDILKKRGISVPGDISVASVDNSELAVLGEVAITSAVCPMENLGKKAAENLLRLIRDPLFDADYEFDTEVISRDSVSVDGRETMIMVSRSFYIYLRINLKKSIDMMVGKCYFRLRRY